jgi:hypothetical protein
MSLDVQTTRWEPAALPETMPLSAPADTDFLQVQVLDDPGSPDWQAAAQIEANVFIEKGYVKSPEELAEEYAPYLGSTAMIALKLDMRTVGALRVIDYDPTVGFKTEHDISEGRLLLDEQGEEIMANLDRYKTLEAGTIALPEELRASHGKKYAAILYGAFHVLVKSRNKDTAIASFDAGYFRGFARKYSDFVTAIGPAVHYMGSPTVPAVMDATKVSIDRFM